jgi:hypothetical protein
MSFLSGMLGQAAQGAAAATGLPTSPEAIKDLIGKQLTQQLSTNPQLKAAMDAVQQMQALKDGLPAMKGAIVKEVRAAVAEELAKQNNNAASTTGLNSENDRGLGSPNNGFTYNENENSNGKKAASEEELSENNVSGEALPENNGSWEGAPENNGSGEEYSEAGNGEEDPQDGNYEEDPMGGGRRRRPRGHNKIAAPGIRQMEPAAASRRGTRKHRRASRKAGRKGSRRSSRRMNARR